MAPALSSNTARRKRQRPLEARFRRGEQPVGFERLAQAHVGRCELPLQLDHFFEAGARFIGLFESQRDQPERMQATDVIGGKLEAAPQCRRGV